jgi:hypothetical protein
VCAVVITHCMVREHALHYTIMKLRSLILKRRHVRRALHEAYVAVDDDASGSTCDLRMLCPACYYSV